MAEEKKQESAASDTDRKTTDDENDDDSEQKPELRRRKTIKIDDDEQKAKKRKTLAVDEADDFQVVEDDEHLTSAPTISTTIQRKKPLRIFYTREIAQWFGREQFLIVSMREALFYLIFLVILYIVTFGHITASTFFYTKVMSTLLTSKNFKSQDQHKSLFEFHRLNEIDHVWVYLHYVLVSIFKREFLRNTEKQIEVARDEMSSDVLHENELIGLPRLRQVIVHNSSCEIPEDVKFMFNDCYGPYTESAENKEAFSLNIGAFKYVDSDHTGSYSYTGEIGTYGGGGYLVDFNRSISEINVTLNALQNKLWINRGTRAVFLDFTTYNANINLFCIIKIVFELPPTGGIISSSVFKTQKLIRFISFADYIKIVCGIFYVMFFIYYVAEELYEMFYFRWEYITSFWNWVDLILVIFMYAMMSLDIYEYIKIRVDLAPFIVKNDVYPNFDALSSRESLYGIFLAITMFFVWLKMLKYLNIFDTMYELQETISKAAVDLLSLFAMGLILFAAFAHSGHLLFGIQVEGFHTFYDSMITLLSTLVGAFDYGSIEAVHSIIGPIYFTTFIYVVFIILFNLLIAILVDAYEAVRNQSVTRKIQMSVGDVLKKGYVWLLDKFGWHRRAQKQQEIIDQSKVKSNCGDIRKLLERCGYTELEIDLFFAKYDISEYEPISEEDMNTILANISTAGPHSTEAVTVHDYQLLYNKMNERVTDLENAIVAANQKVDIILERIDAIQELQMARKSSVSEIPDT